MCIRDSVRPGGLLIGDDFNWRAVAHDVQLFARTHNLSVSSFDNCHEGLRTASKAGLCVWFLRKPLHERVAGMINRRPSLREWRGGRWCEPAAPRDGRDGTDGC